MTVTDLEEGSTTQITYTIREKNMAPDPTSPIPPVLGSIKAQIQEVAAEAADAGQHGVVLDALRQFSERPGIKTSEFYFSLVTGALGGVLTLMPGKELYGAILTSVAVLSYNLSRGITKAGQA